MKKSKYPRLRTKTYKGRSGQVWVYFTYDMRAEGKPDIRLGRDHASAIERWHELHSHLPQTVGRLQEAFDRWRRTELPTYTNPETRKSYEKHLRRLEPVFGTVSWHEITLPMLRLYLEKRSAKTQGNRELSVLSIIWGRARLWGMTQLPWPSAGVKNWKNQEKAREFEVTDAIFDALYEQADQVLRDCLDIATATGMRITDARTVRTPVDGKLRFRAAKTGKWAYFDVNLSPVLTALLERRGDTDALTLLCTPTGRPVSMSMLRDRYERARDKAATANPTLADGLRAMFLRDSRKRAADLAEDIDAASKLLQHSSVKLTQTHYRSRATELKAVR